MSQVSPHSERNKDFFQQVWAVVKLIPEGRVSSYGAIAEYLGAKRGARMVGWAMNACLKDGNDVPAHRVVNRQGMLSGKMHFPDSETMQRRLEAEGVVVIEDQVRDFEERFWSPMLELSI